MAPLVVRRDGNIDILGRRIGIAERDDGDIDIGRFLDGLCVGARVRDDDQAGFFERARDVVGEVAWGEAPCDGGGAGVGGEFEDGALAVGAGGDHGDVGGVIDCGDDAGCEDDFFPVQERASQLRISLTIVGVDGPRVSTYQVLPILITLMPSGRVFHR